ncbi:DUF5134 domain-containing protein [Streptomyces sp. NBC_01020]|uniref:DUF5134 domain-containing protein n=1 Tax=unclassified Streptomyces TaxID=2593676 RepID=UPI002E233F65|nr:DUF5134 domain-containing protein [Streptomyces sp. NBC_01020]WSX71854.1 DUF5134 domain-containing protein [Streptomyces sp. NBC_00932]
MINATGLRWILTALFTFPALYALWSTAAPGRTPANRVEHTLHAVMGFAMTAMAWPWGMDLPAGPQIVVFSAGGVWFAAAALARASRANTRTAALVAALPHIVMMGAMAWMATVMNGSGMAAGAGGAGHDMPGMDMAGTNATSAMTLSRAGDQWTACLLAVALVILGLRWLAQAFDHGRVAVTPATPRGTTALLHSEASEPACHAAMAVGMGVMLVLLV